LFVPESFFDAYSLQMPSLSPERMRRLALDALEEVVAEAEHRPVPRTWALRLSLAYLSLHAPRWRNADPYRDFWRAMSLQGSRQRHQRLEDALRTVYAYANEKRDSERVAYFEAEAERSSRSSA
jgi:hypothetical protein